MKVVISGYYGFGNLGDEALLSGMLGALRPRHQVTVLSQQPAATRSLHGVAAAHRYYQALSALLKADALISGGGGLLQDSTSRRSLYYYLWLLRLARRLGKRVIVYGQSLGPLSAQGELEVAKVLKGLPVAVRDRPSQALLARHDLTAELVADSALLLREGAPSALSRQRVILIPRAGYPDITVALVEAGRRLAASGHQLAALALHADADAAELARLQAELPQLTVLRASSPVQVTELLMGAHYVVSARLHGLILAAVTQTPYAGLVYDPKVAAFLAETAAPCFAPPIDAAALAACVQAVTGPSQAAVTALKARAQQGLNWLLAQLDGCS